MLLPAKPGSTGKTYQSVEKDGDTQREAMVSHNLGPDGSTTMSSCSELGAPGSSISSCSMPVGGEEAPASEAGEVVGRGCTMTSVSCAVVVEAAMLVKV